MTDEEIKKIFEDAIKDAEKNGINVTADRNDTLEADDVEITLPTKLEREAAEKEANDPKYDIYDTDEDWDG